MERVVVGDIPVHLFTEESLHSVMAGAIDRKEKLLVLNSNAYLVTLANSTDKWLKEFFSQEVDYVMCDGAGIQVGAWLTRQPVPEKIAYNVWFWRFSEFCAERGYSIFLLGGRKGVAEKAAANLRARAQGLRLYTHHGFFDKTAGSADNEKVLAEINKVKPNILLVCFGMPAQEKYIRDNFHRLDANIFMSGGGALDFFSGSAKTAPWLFRKLALEWFYRMCREPGRLWKRYLIGNFRFMYHVLRTGRKRK